MDSIPAVDNNIDNEAAVADDATYESLDIVVRVIRNDEKFSFRFASSTHILRIEKEELHRRILFLRRFVEEAI